MNHIDELLTRGVDKIYPSREELEKVLRSGKKLTLYQGFDPTGTQLHLGHMIGLRKLRQWQDLGHHVIFLIGDFTGMIGDPSGKTTARTVKTHEEVLENAKSYKEQAAKILKFEGPNAAEIKYNGEWLGKISALEFFRIAGLLSVQQVVERDMFQERQKQGQDIYMNEFLYPVMQAYDCVAMDVDLEVGGSDQMFNMLMGRKLMRHMLKKDKFVMTLPLLTDAQGRKIGKTEGNVIALNDPPDALYGKIMTLPDEILGNAFEYLTSVPMERIMEIRKQLEKTDNPMPIKKSLAHQIVSELYDINAADVAADDFESRVQLKELPKEVPTVTWNQEGSLVDFLVQMELADSRTNAKRLIEQGGVTIDGNQVDTKPNDLFIIEDDQIVGVGKRKFVRVKSK